MKLSISFNRFFTVADRKDGQVSNMSCREVIQDSPCREVICACYHSQSIDTRL